MSDTTEQAKNRDVDVVDAPSTPAAAVKTGTDARYTDTDVERIVKERLAREQTKSAEAARKAAEAAAAEEAKKNGEWQKVAEAKAKELEVAQSQLKTRELADKKRAIAEKVGLSAALSSRLVGETDADIEADAKALLETLPKPTKPAPGINATNPASATTQETREQKKARLAGTSPDVFATGAGVFWGEKP